MTVKDRYPSARDVKLTISHDLIQQSMQRNSGHCMIAEAVKMAVPDARHVSVDIATIRFSDPARNVRFTYLTPRKAQEALVAFDQGDIGLRAFSLTLRHQDAIVTRTGRRRRSQGSPELRHSHGDGAEGVPRRVGGAPPPRAALSNLKGAKRTGQRREFGLRALVR